MKTALKNRLVGYTAIAVITVLVALSCAPEVTLTDRDLGEYKDQFDVKYTNSQDGIDLVINVSGSLTYSASATSDSDRTITIIFPAEADVLKVSNNDIVAEINKFLTFYTYTNPTPVAGTYTPSALTKFDAAKTFVSRGPVGTNTVSSYVYRRWYNPDGGVWVDTSHRDYSGGPSSILGYRDTSLPWPDNGSEDYDVSYYDYWSVLPLNPVYPWNDDLDGYGIPGHDVSGGDSSIVGYRYTTVIDADDELVSNPEWCDVSYDDYWNVLPLNPVYPWVSSGYYDGAWEEGWLCEDIDVDGQPITITLASLPNANSIVWELDASAYKINGQPLDLNGDGESKGVWDKMYGELPIDGSTSTTSPAFNSFIPPIPIPASFYTLTLGFSSSGSFTAGGTVYACVAYFNESDAESKTARENFLKSITGKFELQKYNKDSTSWDKQTADIAFYASGATLGTGTTDAAGLYLSFKPENLGIYRLVANGMNNLQTADKIGSDVAKIIVNNPGDGDPTFLKKTFYLEPRTLYESTVKWVSNNPSGGTPTNPANPFETRTAKVTSDANKKNVVIDLSVGTINLNTPETLDLAAFNKTFKLIYPKNGILDDDLGNLVELKINKVEYITDKRYADSPLGTNLIRITLDPAYQLSGRSIPTYIMVTTGFKYSGDPTITFGNPSNNFPYAGSFFWENYGTIGGL